jgi:hypothetical protein
MRGKEEEEEEEDTYACTHACYSYEVALPLTAPSNLSPHDTTGRTSCW